MSRLVKSMALLLLWAGLLLGATNANAVACNSLATGSWGTAGTWSCAHVPLAADDVTIVAGHTITMNVNGGVARSLLVNGTATWTQARTTNVGVGGVAINGNITSSANGGLTSTGGLALNAILTSTQVTITLQTTAAQTISGTGTLQNLTVTGAGVTATNTGTLTARGTLSTTGTVVNNGTLTVTGALSGSGGLTNSATGVLNLGGTSGITTLTATAAGNTVNYTGAAAQTIKATTYANLTASGAGVKTISAATTVNATMTVDGTVNNNSTLTVTGALSGAGALTNVANRVLNLAGIADIATLTATAGGNTVNYTGGGAQTIKATTYAILTASGAGAKTVSAPTTVNATMTVAGAVTNDSTLTVTGALSGGGGLTNNATGVLNLAGTSTITALTATAAGNTVNYTGGSQTVKATTYHHLGLSGSGGKTFTSATIGGDLTLSGSATATLSGVTSVGRDLILSGTATATTAANFSIGRDLTIGTGTTFTSPNFTNSVGGATSVTGTLTHTGAAAKTYTGAVTINTGGSWNNATAPVTFRGGLTHNGTTFTAGTGVYTFDTNAQAIGGSSAIAIPSLTVNGVPLTHNGTLTVATALSGTGELINSASQVLNIGGSAGITTLTASAVGNTVNYTGAVAQTIKATTYDILTTSGAGAKTISGAATVNASMTVTGGTVTNNSTLTVTGALSGAGALTNSASGVLNLGGSSGITTLTATAVGNTVNYTGAAAQTIYLTTYHHLGISGGDKTLGGAMTANGVLTLTSGTITTGANTLTLSASCPGSYSRSGGHVIGNLLLTFPVSVTSTTCSYHVGDSTGYAPMVVTVGPTTGGTLTGRVDAGDHPDTISSLSGIDPAKSANHYWTLTAGTLTTYTSYSASFQFCANTGSCVTPTELDTGANTGNFIVVKKLSGSWLTPTVGTRTAYSTEATGITSANGFGVFAVGEVNLCFTDSFAGGLGNWSVGSQSGSFTPAIVSGRLRLTDLTNSQSTWATLQLLFPAAGNKATLEFEHFAYGGTGGDGMAVVISNGSVAPVVGAFGGSLGYAQKSNPGSDCVVVGGCPGFAGGWLGIALDEYGNFSNPIEGRNLGPGQVVDSVSIRGSGSGQSGYRYLQGTTTLSPGVDGNNVPPGTVAHRYRIILDNTDTVHTYVSVERDTTSGAGSAYTSLIAPFDVKDPGYGQSAIPAGFNLSFTGSTGAATNIHEITNLRVCTVQPLVAPTLHHIQIDHGGGACTNDPAPVTVKACANAACTALYMDSVTVNLIPNITGALTWAPTEPVTFTGGSVAMTLNNTSANTQTLGGTATAPTTGNATQCFSGATPTCSLVFNTCTVDAVESSPTSVAGTPIFTKLANVAFNLDAVRTAGGNQNVSLIELVDASSGTCGTYPALPSTIAPPTVALSNGTPRATVSFTNNSAAPNVRVRMTTGGGVKSCSSDNFAVRPQAFTVTSSASNAGTGGTPRFRAGTDTFSMTATAVYGATTTTGYNGFPHFNASLISTSQAHLGTVTATTFPAASSGVSTASGFKYDEVGNFSLTQYAVYDDSFADVDTVKGECVSGFSNTLDGNGKYSCQFGSSAAGPFGRFVPDHFTVTGAVANACTAGAFTYMGQPFTLSPAGVVEARNFANGVTINYAGAYAPGTITFGAENADDGTDLGASLVFFPSLSALGGTWTSGIYTLTSGTAVTFARPVASPSGPFDALDLGLTVADADVAALGTSPLVAGADMNPTTVGNNTLIYRKFSGSPLKMRFGRLRLLNAFGSERMALPMPWETQYWNGQAFIRNTQDSCTSLLSANILLGMYTAPPNPGPIVLSGANLSTVTVNPINAGLGTLTLAPTANATGSVALVVNLGSRSILDVVGPSSGGNCTSLIAVAPLVAMASGTPIPASSAMPYLNGRWCGVNHDQDPFARASFGVYKSPLIYRRENY